MAGYRGYRRHSGRVKGAQRRRKGSEKRVLRQPWQYKAGVEQRRLSRGGSHGVLQRRRKSLTSVRDERYGTREAIENYRELERLSLGMSHGGASPSPARMTREEARDSEARRSDYQSLTAATASRLSDYQSLRAVLRCAAQITAPGGERCGGTTTTTTTTTHRHRHIFTHARTRVRARTHTAELAGDEPPRVTADERDQGASLRIRRRGSALSRVSPSLSESLRPATIPRP